MGRVWLTFCLPIAPKIRMFDLRRDFKAIRNKVIMNLLLV
jgi:hypothetical protein